MLQDVSSCLHVGDNSKCATFLQSFNSHNMNHVSLEFTVLKYIMYLI